MTQTQTSNTYADWRSLADDPLRLRKMAFVGRYHAARRCIDAPILELTAIDGASCYDVVASPISEPSLVSRVVSSRPQVDLAPVWDALPFDLIQLSGRAFGPNDEIVGVTDLKTLVKGADWDGRVESPLDYRKAAAGVIGYLCNRLPEAPSHPTDPAYIWHASTQFVGSEIHSPLQFPALSFPMMINLFLTGHRLGIGNDLLERSSDLADFLIDHPMVADGPLAGIPMSTMGQDGSGGLYETDRTTIVRIGWTGSTMLDLAQATGNPRYKQYALRLGEILLATQ